MNEEELLKEVGLYNKRFIAVVKNGFVDFIQDKKDKNNGILFIDRDVIKALTEVKEKYQEENIDFYNEGFQKGKLEERKRIITIIEKWRFQLEDEGIITIDKHFVDELQKEIWGMNYDRTK